MLTFVLLTKLSSEALLDPSGLERLSRKVSEQIRSQCPNVKWVSSYSILGPYDYFDIFEAPDEKSAAKVALIIRSFGHAVTETWLATPWEKFVNLTKEIKETVGALH